MMAYVMIRDDASLKLKAGDKLKYEEGKLPSALKFAAKWTDGSEPEEKSGFTQADLDAAFEKGKASVEPQGDFVVNEDAVKKFFVEAIEAAGEKVRDGVKLSTLASKYEDLDEEKE